MQLLNLKEWVTAPEAARHLAGIFKEDVTEADVLQMALDGRLQLSVRFINLTDAWKWTVVHVDDPEYKLKLLDAVDKIELGDGRYLLHIPPELPDIPKQPVSTHYALLEDVWDLPMVGGERVYVKCKIQELIAGQRVDLAHQRSWQAPSRHDVFVTPPNSTETFYALGRPDDGFCDHSGNTINWSTGNNVLVVRTAALQKFLLSMQRDHFPPSAEYISADLKTLYEAALQFWSSADPHDSSTHSSNGDIIKWLKDQGLSDRKASVGATIIRPEWGRKGRPV